MADEFKNLGNLASILPVLDLKNNQIVRGIAGNRASYRPIVSRIAFDARPETIAQAFVETYGFRDAYIADLDAIAGESPAMDVYRAVMARGIDLVIDPGIGSIERAAEMAAFANDQAPVAGLVVALESLTDERQLLRIRQELGTRRAIFSLDLRNSQPITSIPTWKNYSPDQIAELAIDAGFERLIVLDLGAVGTRQGIMTGGICRALKDRHPAIEIISGGGVRSREDVQSFVAAGCSRVLVASALHDGFPESAPS